MMAASLRILIVDDSADNALMLQILLEQEGYAARIASDGRAAIAVARDSPPDVFLLDLGLPDMDGCELAAGLRRIPELRDRRLVAVTGHGEEALPSPSPFDRYFRKPVPLDALVAYLAAIPDEPTRPSAAAIA